MIHIPSTNFSNCEKEICYTGLKLLDNQPHQAVKTKIV